MRPLSLSARLLLHAVALGLTACGAEGDPSAWAWDLPADFPEPEVPEDNPMTLEKVELGRWLFHDVGLSENQTQSCGSCHLQELAWTDGLAQGEGSTGEVHPRGPMGLVNVAYASTLNWANPVVRTLEDQAMGPLFGETPVELGMAGKEDLLLERLAEDADYQELFAAAWPQEEDPFSLVTVTHSIAAFERALVSADSPYDRAVFSGEWDALSDDAIGGMELFFSEELECFHCHGGANFTDSFSHEDTTFDTTPFHNNGLYNLDGEGAYPADNTGVHAITGDPADMGRHRAPSLRNIALTAPYMHDGSIETLDEVIDHYAAGGRTIEDGEHAGDGSTSPLKSAFVSGFELSEAERRQLKAFLGSLTDETLLTDPRFSDPFSVE